MNNPLKVEGASVVVMLILTAETAPDGTVQINGDKSKKKLNKGDPPTEFRFTLVNQTKPRQDVEFTSLDTEDKVPCPPSAGLNSTQIPASSVEIDGDKASFTNLNNNQGQMDVAYQWNLRCADGQQATFDPIIDNRGRV